MFGYQFPTWLPLLFFAILLVTSFLVGTWLNKTDRNYNGLFKRKDRDDRY